VPSLQKYVLSHAHRIFSGTLVVRTLSHYESEYYWRTAQRRKQGDQSFWLFTYNSARERSLSGAAPAPFEPLQTTL
jgi:hypothetical protein